MKQLNILIFVFCFHFTSCIVDDTEHQKYTVGPNLAGFNDSSLNLGWCSRQYYPFNLKMEVTGPTSKQMNRMLF
jgi:hypothetical protein